MAMTYDMRDFKKGEKKEIKRLQEVYKLNEQDAIEMFIYDRDYTDSDEDVKTFFKEELTTAYMDEKEIEDIMYKTNKAADKPKVSTKANSEASKINMQKRLEALAKELESKKELFGDLVEMTTTELKYVAPETGLPLTIKISKHKVQKVVAKTIKRKKVTLEDGTRVDAPLTEIDFRATAVGEAMQVHVDLFEAYSAAGTAFGFVTNDVKFPFGSVKITHHKKVATE